MRKTVTITLYMTELLYDVENKTYLTGEARDNGQNYEESADMKANDDAENRNQVMRSIGNAFGTLKTKLGEYLDEAGTTANNVLTSDQSNLQVVLSMPSNYNTSTKDTIATAMHQYIVNLAIAEWFNIFNKADSTEYLTMAAANLTNLREALNKRVRPVRRPVSNI